MFGSVELRVKFGIFELRLSICKGDFLNLFSKFSLEVVPARLTPGFRVKFGVGRVIDSHTRLIRLRLTLTSPQLAFVLRMGAATYITS